MKIVEGPSTLIDGIGHFSEDGAPWVYHFAPRHEGGGLIADHPWDDSYEAKVCPVCEGDPV
jgi:hypothetical protein